LGQDVQRAVITVPAYFDEHQRQATRQAGELAGLRVERIINEPTAATLVYHADKHDRKHIVVYDLGGGTFDVSIVRLEAGVIEVLASQGDTHLGGDDIDHLLLDFVADDFLKKHDIDLRKEPQAKFRLLQACEQAKIRLSEAETVAIAEEFIGEKNGQPLHVQISISREELDEMILPLIERTISCVSKALRDASMTIHQMDDLVLVGGSTRIPLVSSKLRDQFLRQPSRAVDPDLAVALGAAVQAAMLQGQSVGPVLVDMATHTLGIIACVSVSISGPELINVPIIHRGSPLPARYEEAFSKMFDEQRQVEIEVLQGEHPEPNRNIPIGSLKLSLTGDDDSHRKVVVGFDLTLDGVLKVTAKQPASGRVEELVVDNALSQFAAHEREAAQSRLQFMFEQSTEIAELDELVANSEFHDDVRADNAHRSPQDSRLNVLKKARERFPKTASLLERAVALGQQVQGEDAEDLETLCEQIYSALETDDEDSIKDLTADLDDMLFYVQ
jgi:molecular chaperone DnaK